LKFLLFPNIANRKKIDVFVQKRGIELLNLFEYIQGYWWISKFLKPELAEYF